MILLILMVEFLIYTCTILGISTDRTIIVVAVVLFMKIRTSCLMYVQCFICFCCTD